MGYLIVDTSGNVPVFYIDEDMTETDIELEQESYFALNDKVAEMKPQQFPLIYANDFDEDEAYSPAIDTYILRDIADELIRSDDVTDRKMARHILRCHFVCPMIIADEHFDSYIERINPGFQWKEMDYSFVDDYDWDFTFYHPRLILIFIPDDCLPAGTYESDSGGFDINYLEYVRLAGDRIPSPLYKKKA